MGYSMNREAPKLVIKTFGCGHPRTDENSYHCKSTDRIICLTCKRTYARNYSRENYRKRYLKTALPAQERKLASMRKEAAALGLTRSQLAT